MVFLSPYEPKLSIYIAWSSNSLSFEQPVWSFIIFTIFLKLETAHTRENSPPAFLNPLKLNRLNPPVFIWPKTGSTIILRFAYISRLPHLKRWNPHKYRVFKNLKALHFTLFYNIRGYRSLDIQYIIYLPGIFFHPGRKPVSYSFISIK